MQHINECIDSSVEFSASLRSQVFAVEQDNIACETLRLRREAKSIVWKAVMLSSEFCRANWPYHNIQDVQDGVLRNINPFA